MVAPESEIIPRFFKTVFRLTPVHYCIIHNSNQFMDEGIKKTWFIQIIKYYSALKKKEIVSYAATWMNLKDVMLSEISQSQKTHCIILLR